MATTRRKPPVGPPAPSTSRAPSRPGGVDRLRRGLATPAEDLAWILVAVGALLLAGAFTWLAPPLSNLYPAPIHDEFTSWRVAIAPEPLEETRAILTLATPVLLAA